jgi:hypothetical protein
MLRGINHKIDRTLGRHCQRCAPLCEQKQHTQRRRENSAHFSTPLCTQSQIALPYSRQRSQAALTAALLSSLCEFGLLRHLLFDSSLAKPPIESIALCSQSDEARSPSHCHTRTLGMPYSSACAHANSQLSDSGCWRAGGGWAAFQSEGNWLAKRNSNSRTIQSLYCRLTLHSARPLCSSAYSPVPVGESIHFAPFGDYFTADYVYLWSRDLPALRAMGISQFAAQSCLAKRSNISQLACSVLLFFLFL